MRADKAPVLQALKTARGQIDGIIGMVEDDRYCVDIVNQLLACDAMIKRAAKLVLKGHIEGCVSDAVESGGDERNKKIDEIISVIDKLGR